MLPFVVQIKDGVPVSDQITQAVRKAMLTGQLASGDEFPSVRALSQELRISPTTAHKVVSQLKEAARKKEDVTVGDIQLTYAGMVRGCGPAFKAQYVDNAAAPDDG